MSSLIECVPNFSEGRDLRVINAIAESIRRVDGVKLLHIDRGEAANRTVITFLGSPECVVEAAFNAIEVAARLIDMRNHKGEHPRIGATDVCPLVPVSGISMEETVQYARQLAEKVAKELGIPVYCYEDAAFSAVRRSLANCRKGEYEGLGEKVQMAEWRPDFGPAELNLRSGATIIGARNFLIAYNVNLDTANVDLAKGIAAEVRESGYLLREGDSLSGKPLHNEQGETIRIPGALKKVRAIGWFIKEYGVAQVSMNLLDTAVTPLAIAFEQVKERALLRGVHVTGSELIGLIPLQVLLDAGLYFLQKENNNIHPSDDQIIKIAVDSLGLDELAPFDPSQRILEYLISEE